MFHVQHGGYDTHQNLDDIVGGLISELDTALDNFADEMKMQNLWDNVTVITLSDFGRTLTSNGLGTDHAWGGHNVIMGGSVAGGTILGQYPDQLHQVAGSLNIGRGRIIPT